MSHEPGENYLLIVHSLKWRIPIFYRICTTNWNSLFVSYAQIAIAKVPTTIRINPVSAFLLNFSLNTK